MIIIRIVKIFFGVFLCMAAFGFIIATEQMDGSEQPVFIILTFICIIGAILLFRSARKKKKIKKNITSNNINSIPDIQNNPSNSPNKYIYGENGNVIRRTDGRKITKEDAEYLSELGHKKRKSQIEEIGNRPVTNGIITDVALNKREIYFFNVMSDKFLENNLNPGFINLNRLGSGALNVYYETIYVGKIYIPEADCQHKYRVIKDGNTKATRIYDDLSDAQTYIMGKTGYSIENKSYATPCWSQYLDSWGNPHDMENCNINSIQTTIPSWITYIQYTERKMKKNMN